MLLIAEKQLVRTINMNLGYLESGLLCRKYCSHFNVSEHMLLSKMFVYSKEKCVH